MNTPISTLNKTLWNDILAFALDNPSDEYGFSTRVCANEEIENTQKSNMAECLITRGLLIRRVRLTRSYKAVYGLTLSRLSVMPAHLFGS